MDTTSVMVTELYDALRKAGVDERMARDAASAVLPSDVRAALTTKTDLANLRSELKVDLAEMKVDLIKWNVGAMALLTAIFAGIVRLS